MRTGTRFGVLLLVAGSLGTIGVTPLAAEGPAEEQIVESRRRGVEYLKSKQKADGSWEFKDHDLGITALCTIALIENGVPVADPVVQKSYESVKKGLANLKGTYDLSLATVMLTRIGDRRDRPQIKTLVARLLAGQLESGGWHYNCPGQELDVEKALSSQGVRLKEGNGDNSCTQFAVLGLWVGSRSGVNIDKALARVSKRFAQTQLEDGGWNYVLDAAGKGAGSSPAMTVAGLFCLAVAEATEIREAIKSGKRTEGASSGKSLLQDEAFSRGFKRTGNFVQGVGAGSPRYFLWSVERIGVLLGLERMGEADWFAKGADALLQTQTEGGGWPPYWPETDKGGLSDTSFALLFLRKANLGSDISRLLEGEHAQKFEIVGRQPPARFDTLEQAVADAKPGETVRINGPGPYKVGHLELKSDLTIQAGFGYAPVLKHEIGVNRLGIKLRPETEPNGRDMLFVADGNVTLEGLKLQMDPPTTAKPVPWRAVTVKSGSLRLLNCTISESNKRGTTGVVLEAPGQLVVRNSLFVGGKGAVEIVASGKQKLLFDNSVAFCNAGVVLSQDEKSPQPADVALELTNSVFQVKEVIDSTKLPGKVDVVSRQSVYQAEWLASGLLPGPNDTKGRTWTGSFNLYDVKQWIGSGGRQGTAGLRDVAGWSKLWGNSETDAFGRTVLFVGLRQLGNFAHEVNPQEWQLDLPADVEASVRRARIGINAYVAGPGVTFDQFRETVDYSEWRRKRPELAAGRSGD